MSCQSVECIKELRKWIEPFTTFTDDQVFKQVESSNWVWVTPSKSMDTLESLPHWKHSNSSDCRARTRGMVPTRGIGHSKLIVPSAVNTLAASGQGTGASNIFKQQVKNPHAALLHGSRCHHLVLSKSLSPCREMTPPHNHQCIPGTGPTLGGGIYHGNEQDGPGLVRDDTHQHDDLSVKCDGPRVCPTLLHHQH